MKILYTDETLFVSINEKLNQNKANNIYQQINNLSKDYDISNIILNVNNFDMNMDTFIKTYNEKEKM